MQESKGGPWLILAAGLLVGTALGLLVFFGMPSASPLPGSAGAPVAGTPAPAPYSGAPAPDFTLETLEGGRLALSDLKGEVVLLNFWFTTCGPCQVEMPAIQSRYDRHRDAGLRVLAINFDEPEADVEEFVGRLGLSFDVLLDPGASVQNLYRIRGYPTSFFVDREGIVQVSHIGLMTEAQLDGYLKTLGLDSP